MTAPSPEIEPGLRDWLAGVADLLIPASDDRPAASEAGVSGAMLDVVLRARPDLCRPVTRAWELTSADPPEVAMAELAELDPAAGEAVELVVAGGYYANPAVRTALGYPGQIPRTVKVGDVPEYVTAGLLERVVERGPLFRPDGSAGDGEAGT